MNIRNPVKPLNDVAKTTIYCGETASVIWWL
nr:MAG TPA: hypothetical protein [Inoviridae sp.]